MSVESSRYLVLETSGRVGAVAVASGATVLCVQHLDEARRHARDLAPVLGELLGERGWKPRDVDAVIVCTGPGSYTGLRVGVMSAKTFAYATGCAVIGVSAFAAIAAQAPNGVSQLDVLADAQQDKVYFQRFERADGQWRPTTPLRVMAFTDWLSDRGETALVSGPGLRRWGSHVPDGERIAPESSWDPLPQSLLHQGEIRHRAGERDDLYALEPLYLRPSSAEEQWRDRGVR